VIFFDRSTHLVGAVVIQMQVLTTLIRFTFAYLDDFLPLPLPNRADSQRNWSQRNWPDCRREDAVCAWTIQTHSRIQLFPRRLLRKQSAPESRD